MSNIYVLFCFISTVFSAATPSEITPFKYEDAPAPYDIPLSARLTTTRAADEPDIVYYLSRPTQPTYPIAILCGGSTLEADISSIIHFHRYFLKEFLDLGVGVLTVEQHGVDGNTINAAEFMQHYTRSNRLQDHCTLIEHLKKNPPVGWDGKFVFLGVSEGGPIVTTLTERYCNMTIATINWCGAGDWNWREELWTFLQDYSAKTPWYIKARAALPSWVPGSLDLYFPKSRETYDLDMDATIKNPSTNLKLAGMTYKYHQDTLINYPQPNYHQLKVPMLVVAGCKDSIIASSNAFATKVRNAGGNLLYWQVPDMDHYIRKRPEIIEKSFEWLKEQIEIANVIENSINTKLHYKGPYLPIH